MDTKKITILYFASLREERGLELETLSTSADTPLELYHYLKEKHQLSLDERLIRVSINEEVADWQQQLHDNDSVVFIPPVAGG
jgi:molybdopterin converting factor subunit 1